MSVLLCLELCVHVECVYDHTHFIPYSELVCMFGAAGLHRVSGSGYSSAPHVIRVYVVYVHVCMNNSRATFVRVRMFVCMHVCM